MAAREPEGNRKRNYTRMKVDGLEVYWHQALTAVAPQVIISLAGFWKFRWPRARGVVSQAACAI